MGCGITGYNLEDAYFILRKDVFKGMEYVKPIKVVEEIHIPTLDENHIIPNMLPPNIRGVWFPSGYNYENK